MEKYEKQLKECTITAPADGIVTAIDLKEGAVYSGSESLIIQNNENYKISGAVDQYDIGKIKNGMSVLATVGTSTDTAMTGKLTFISPTPKTTTSSAGVTETSSDYNIEASIENPQSTLRIGMTVKLVITLEEKKGALVVPDSCVQTADDGSYYIEVADDESDLQNTRKVTVTYGMKTDYYVEITGKNVKEGMIVKYTS